MKKKKFKISGLTALEKHLGQFFYEEFRASAPLFSGFESCRTFRSDKDLCVILNKSYDYDVLGRVNRVENAINSTIPTTIGMGGSYVNEYLYDSFNRLSEAKGTFGGTQTYQVAMEYNALRLRSAQAHRFCTARAQTIWAN